MDKIIEALKNLLPADQINEVSAALEGQMKESHAKLETEFNQKLEEAYAELSKELKGAEKVAEEGYAQAHAVIEDQRNRMQAMQTEYETHNDEVCEEAFNMLMGEKKKNEELEKGLYEEYDSKLLEMKEYVVTKIDEFLQHKGQEIYEQARRDILGDPRYAEHKVALDRIVDITANYMDTEERAIATGSKLEEAHQKIKDLHGQLHLMEARTIRLDSENRKLNETVENQKTQVLTESKKTEKQERVKNAQNATGRGRVVTEEQVEVIKEHKTPETPKATDTNGKQLKIESVEDLKVLAGLSKTN